MNKPSTPAAGPIALNRKAHHDYHVETRYEAGIVLRGWEVKSLRAGRLQLKDSYVIINNNEAWLLNAHISPLNTISTHVVAEPERTRKLLLNRREISKLIGATQREGYTIVPLKVYWQRNNAKVEIALVKGKKEYDKRDSEKKKEWQREKGRLMKSMRLK